jgi:5-methylcytosine-specific restriction endonuclease McrA
MDLQVKARKKERIPVALREAVWIHRQGRVFEGKCLTTWCPNIITVFDFQCGHDIPESKGGLLTLDNLYPLCSRCNLSMGDRYNYKEWCNLSPSVETPLEKRGCWFFLWKLKGKNPTNTVT